MCKHPTHNIVCDSFHNLKCQGCNEESVFVTPQFRSTRIEFCIKGCRKYFILRYHKIFDVKTCRFSSTHLVLMTNYLEVQYIIQ